MRTVIVGDAIPFYYVKKTIFLSCGAKKTMNAKVKYETSCTRVRITAVSSGLKQK